MLLKFIKFKGFSNDFEHKNLKISACGGPFYKETFQNTVFSLISLNFRLIFAYFPYFPNEPCNPRGGVYSLLGDLP